MDRAGRNDEKSPLRDVRVRRAIAHSINRAEIARKVFGSGSMSFRHCVIQRKSAVSGMFAVIVLARNCKKALSSAGYGPAGKYRIIDKLNNLATRLPEAAGENGKAVPLFRIF